MKRLLLVRHAKSSWDNSSISDKQRPLNERGKKDAPEMARRLLSKQIKIDAFVSSPAERAKATAEYFCAVYGQKAGSIIYDDALYAAAPETFYEVITRIPDQYQSIAIFSHNPGISEFASMLTNARIDEMPTCAIFAIEADATDWSAFRDAHKRFWFFDYPKSGA